MSPVTINLILLLVLSALYLPVLATLLRRQTSQETAAYLFCGYVVISLIIGVGDALWHGGKYPITAQVASDFQAYGALTLSFILLLAIIAFIRRDMRIWLGVGGFWILGFVILVPNLLRLPEVIYTNGPATLTLDRLLPLWSVLGWIVFTIAAIVNVRLVHSKSKQPLYRNRLNYWAPVFLFIFINDLLLIIGHPLPGNFLRLGAAVLGALIIVTHDPPDLRDVARRVLIYIITSLVIVGFYLAGTMASRAAFNALPRYNELLMGAGIAMVLSFVFTPLLSAVRRQVNKWYNLQEYHPSKTLHAYGEQISNILDMQRLANVAVGLIIEAMDITRGFLFLVDSNLNTNGEKEFHLRAVRNTGERQIKILTLSSENPVTKQLETERRPLLQYDIDLLPLFRSVSQPEREWFSHLEAEVYLPIFSKREWIGLLALGAKISGNRYTEEDLVTLSALANQTAVALENARLVDNLVQLNNELRQAYRSLDKANRDLERLDQTKSDFISIASHELRTPLTTMIGYTEMLIEDKSLPEEAHAMLKGISKGTKRLHEIMDSMFDIAQIDTRTLQLHLTPVDTALLIKEVSLGVQKTVEERKQSLVINIPSLPNVKADPNLLKKLFQHLINNAIKFTPNNGKIHIGARLATPQSAETPLGGIEVVVTDSGVGVDPESREIIFSKFYQPGDVLKHSTSKTRFKGSGAGLGLALSKGIVEAHGGRIWVESQGFDDVKCPGSQFHVVLPLDILKDGETATMGTEVNLQLL